MFMHLEVPRSAMYAWWFPDLNFTRCLTVGKQRWHVVCVNIGVPSATLTSARSRRQKSGGSLSPFVRNKCIAISLFARSAHFLKVRLFDASRRRTLALPRSAKITGKLREIWMRLVCAKQACRNRLRSSSQCLRRGRDTNISRRSAVVHEGNVGVR